MSGLRASKYKIDEFPNKEKLILIQKIEFLENENEELRGRETSLRKINAILIDTLNSNPNIEETLLTQLRILNAGKNIEAIIRRYEQEIQKLKEQLSRRDISLSGTHAETLKPQNQQNCVERRLGKGHRLKQKESNTKQYSEIDRFSVVLNPPSVVNSCNYLKHKHRRRFSQKMDEILLREREQEQNRRNQIAHLIKQKGMIERMIQNCERKSNQNIQTPIQSIVSIVKSKKLKEQSCCKPKQISESFVQVSNGKLERVGKGEKFTTPRHIKRYY